MKVIVGAGGRTQEGWVSTEQGQLDLLKGSTFCGLVDGSLGFEAILAEHVFEHLSFEDAKIALNNCFEYLAPGGHIRIAVPDGFHPSQEYIDYVKPGGNGAGALDHKVLYNYKLLKTMMEETGFKVNLLEWWDEKKKFNASLWNEADGYIERCLANDPRNKDGKPNYTSLIMDGFKDGEGTAAGLGNALMFIENADPNRVSVFNRRKATTLYRLGKIAPAGGVVLDMGCHLGISTVPLWYGTMDGNQCEVVAMDIYQDVTGWIGEHYDAKNKEIFIKNMETAGINPRLCVGDARELVRYWDEPISLLVHDLGKYNCMLSDVMDWEKKIIIGGILAVRDIDNYSMGTEETMLYLSSTGRWGKRINWNAFYTSMERIA